MKPTRHRYLLGLILLVLLSIGCAVFSGITERVTRTRERVESAATSIEQGRELLNTAQSVATEIQGNEMVQTLRAVATEEGPRAAATLRAFATDELPGLQATAESLASTQGPSLLATARAAATRVASSVGEIPADIPLMEDATGLFSTSSLVSYQSPTPLLQVEAFYKEAMPLYGWAELSKEEMAAEGSSLLFYSKDTRRANIILTTNPVDQSTVVLVIVQEN